jgi:hypothetical protein
MRMMMAGKEGGERGCGRRDERKLRDATDSATGGRTVWRGRGHARDVDLRWIVHVGGSGGSGESGEILMIIDQHCILSQVARTTVTLLTFLYYFFLPFHACCIYCILVLVNSCNVHIIILKLYQSCTPSDTDAEVV